MSRDEATDALVALRRIVRFLRIADRKAEVACGLSAAQLFVLQTLAAAPNISQAELAARTLTDQSSVSTVVAKLVDRGFVSRSVSKTDRRRTELALTPLGERTLAKAPKMPQLSMIAAIRKMPAAKRAELVRSLANLATAIGADEVAPRMLFDDERSTLRNSACRPFGSMRELTRQFRISPMSYMRSEARAAQILACAKRVFAERGFHNANISHICEAAGIGRGTLYQYFTNKRSVLTAILRETLDRARTLMQRQSTETKYPAPETLSRSAIIAFSARQLRELLDVVFRDGDTLRIVLREAVGLDVDVEKILGEIDETAIAILERDLIRAQKAGILRELDARAVATIVVGGIEKLAFKALRSDAPVDLDKLAMEAALLHTVGTLSDRVPNK